MINIGIECCGCTACCNVCPTGCIQMKENDILVIEGLHTLSNELLKDIPNNKKYKIYISPLVYLNIDDDNRINQTDIRLIRRMVRDARTRGYSPSQTLGFVPKSS